MEKIDIKTSAPMRALAVAKVKYPDFFKAVDLVVLSLCKILYMGRRWDYD